MSASDSLSLSMEKPATEAVTKKRTLRQRAFGGMVWTYSAQPIRILIQLVRSVILTRLLFPEAFGLMALGSVVGTAAQMFADVGIRPSLVQSKRGEDEAFIQTAWTIQIIRGFVLCAVTMALAWPAAIYFGKPEVFWVIFVGALGFIISGFATTADATHQRKMDYKRPVLISMIVPVVNLVALIILAWWLQSVWALIIGGLTGQLFGVIAGHLFLPGAKHRVRLDRECLKELVGFGKWVFISTVLTFMAMQADKVLLGRLLTIDVVGLYSIGLVIAGLPTRLISPIAGSILFPAIAEKARAGDPNLAIKVVQVRAVLLKLTLIVVVGLVVISPALFELLYDPRYYDAGRIAQWLLLAVWFTLLTDSTGQCLLALGKSRSLAMSNAANLLVTLLGALTGFYYFGLEGFIVGYATGNAMGAIVLDHQLHKLGFSVFRQDLIYSLGAIGLGFGLVTMREFLNRDASFIYLGELIGIAVVGLLAAIFAPVIKNEVLGRRRH